MEKNYCLGMKHTAGLSSRKKQYRVLLPRQEKPTGAATYLVILRSN